MRCVWTFCLLLGVAIGGCSPGRKLTPPRSDRGWTRADAFILPDTTVVPSKTAIPAAPIYTPIEHEFPWPLRFQPIAFVMVEFCIAESRKTDSVAAVHGARQLESRAVESVEMWRFKPAVVDGHPTRTCPSALLVYDPHIAFDLGTYFDTRYTRLEKHSLIAPFGESLPAPGPGVLTRPQALQSLDGPAPDSETGPWFTGRTLTLSFCVLKDGTLRNLSVERRHMSPFPGPVLATARDWRFTPATIDGEPVSTCGLEERFRVFVRPRQDMFDDELFANTPNAKH